MRAAIVAAVSTEAQAAEDRASIPDQLQICRQACASHGWQIVAEVTIPGHSRDYVWLEDLEDACPEYRQLMDLVRANGCELVVVRHYDRLWRTSPLQGQVMAVCTQHRVQVYSVLQPMEPVPPEELRPRRGLQGIMELLSGALSEEEQRLRVERAQAGIARRIARGEPGCWTWAPTGYRLVDGALLVDETWAPTVRWIFEQRAQGWGHVKIAKALNAQGMASQRGSRWTQRSISRILTNPTYAGAVFSGQHYNPSGNHEPIIAAALWARVQAENERKSTNTSVYRYALSGLMRCGYCDWAMVYNSNGPRINVRCSQYNASGGTRCQCNGHASHLIEEPVQEAVLAALSDRDAWIEAQHRRLHSAPAERELDALRAQREEVAAQRLRLLDLYQMGSLPRHELERRTADLAERLRTLDQRISQLLVSRAQVEAFAASLAGMSATIERLPDLPPPEQRQIYARLIDAVEITREDLTIQWRV